MKKRIIYGMAALMALFSACQPDDDSPQMATGTDDSLEALLTRASEGQGKSFFLLPDETDFSNIPQDPRNPITTEKVALGKLLFHETGIATDPMKPQSLGEYSCASCHFAGAGFQAGRHQGIGEGGVGFGINGEGREANGDYLPEEMDVQPMRTPPALNTAYQEAMLWNGQFAGTSVNKGTDYAWTIGTPLATNYLGYQGVETQAIAGLKVHRLVLDENMLNNYGYKAMFDAAFPEIDQSNRYSAEMVGLAIAAYERTIVANQSPFQQWLRGQMQAMNELEKEGAMLFFGKAACVDCHTGPALNVMDYYALGMGDLSDNPEPTFMTPADAPQHRGRGSFTGRPEDDYKFKVPQLYNLADSPFLGHGGTFRSIKEVVEYKNAAIPAKENVPASQLAEGFKPLELSDAEVDAITAFLETGLRDPNLTRYEPAALPTGLCFPNADAQSSADLGCQ
ncbi:MAG: cytochrome c peroxidase [Bacteroidota bacterium]